MDRDLASALLSDMVRVRLMEEKCAELYGAGKIRGFLHLYVGEEGVAAGSLRVLEAKDAVVATYRDHAHALLRGVPMTKIMACSTRAPVSTAGTRSSAAASRWRWAWRWPTGIWTIPG
jgi:TPP-dependent pyruvate/acetoin dehydrogenase alpha subunit